jgi:hypothetical protein
LRPSGVVHGSARFTPTGAPPVQMSASRPSKSRIGHDSGLGLANANIRPSGSGLKHGLK